MHFPETVEQCVPPGLGLPLESEDVNQFRSDNYVTSDLPYWRVLDYGAFTVALAAFGVASGARHSLMPTKRDWTDLRNDGWGPSLTAIAEDHGGLKRLQGDLGFYPYGYVPSREELLERYRWVAEEVLIPDDTQERPTIKEIIRWTSWHDLAPQSAITYAVLDNDANPIRRIFGIRPKNGRKDLNRLDIYRFGAEVIDENGGIISHNELNKRYKIRGLKPINVTEVEFGGHNRFWLEFDRIKDTSGLTAPEIINLGIRLAIRTGDRELSREAMRIYAKEQLLPSISSMYHQVGGAVKFREAVQKGITVYDELVTDLEEIGIPEQVTQAFCARFEPTQTFRNTIMEVVPLLRKIPLDSEQGQYVIGLVSSGFDLLNEDIFELQLNDFENFLRRWGFSRKEIVTVASFVPRFDPAAL